MSLWYSKGLNLFYIFLHYARYVKVYSILNLVSINMEMFWNIRFIWARLRNQTAKIPRLLNEPKISLIFQKRCYVFCLSCSHVKHFTPKTSYFRQISFKVYSWNHNAIASTKQNDDVTIKRAYSNRTRPS